MAHLLCSCQLRDRLVIVARNVQQVAEREQLTDDPVTRVFVLQQHRARRHATAQLPYRLEPLEVYEGSDRLEEVQLW